MTENTNKNIWGKIWRPMLGLIALALVFVWTGGLLNNRIKPGKKVHEPGFTLPKGVVTLPVKIEKIPARIDIVGTVESEEKIHLSSRISAYVHKVMVRAGQSIKKGDLLVMLDDREIQEQMAGAQAQFKQAQIEYDRTKQLFEKNASTEQALVAAEYQNNAAKAQLDRIKIMQSYAQITSPIDGIITDRRIEVGDLASPGQVLLSVYDPKNMRLEVPVPVRLVENLQLGQKLNIELDRHIGPFTGHLTEIVSEIDPQSRTQKIKVRIDDVSGNILPGTFGRIWVDDQPHDGILIPASSVYQVGQLELVQVVHAGRVLRWSVKTGPVIGERVEILSGLEDGALILLNPVMED